MRHRREFRKALGTFFLSGLAALVTVGCVTSSDSNRDHLTEQAGDSSGTTSGLNGGTRSTSGAASSVQSASSSAGRSSNTTSAASTSHSDARSVATSTATVTSTEGSNTIAASSGSETASSGSGDMQAPSTTGSDTVSDADSQAMADAGTGDSSEDYSGSSEPLPEACPAAPALTGGQEYCSNDKGSAGNGYGYELWAEGEGTGCMTVFGTGAAFKTEWNDVEDFLARVGLDFDETRTHAQIGTIWADFVETQTGSDEGLTYVGIYGWTVDPLREFYILDDWGATKPAGVASDGTARDEVGTLQIDGETYDVWKATRPLTNTSAFDALRANADAFRSRSTSLAGKTWACPWATCTKSNCSLSHSSTAARSSLVLHR
jgi:endo-1,4-beta-xylanase